LVTFLASKTPLRQLIWYLPFLIKKKNHRDLTVKRWAFVDCFEEVNFRNIDFSDYERIILFSVADIHLPLGPILPTLEIIVERTEAVTQEQLNHALTSSISKYHSTTKRNVCFDIYSNYISQTKSDALLRAEDRHCYVYDLPPRSTITIEQALQNTIYKLNSYADKRCRPRGTGIMIELLNHDWRCIRGRVPADTIILEMKSRGLIRQASNGIYFSF
tara:strand:+ start:7262 stop:7912 length:651 start_codon:yes stop_codon:yes gene_type:complete